MEYVKPHRQRIRAFEFSKLLRKGRSKTGVIDFEDGRKSLRFIRERLSRRGSILILDMKEPDEEWKVHRLKLGVNYQIYIGWAMPKDSDPYEYDGFRVAIYPVRFMTLA